MREVHVWIDYQPRLYQDLLVGYFRHMNQRTARVNVILHTGSFEDCQDEQQEIDVLLLSLDRIELHNRPAQPGPIPHTRFIAFSPKGNQGWKRPGLNSQWELMRPFGLDSLLSEVLKTDAQTALDR